MHAFSIRLLMRMILLGWGIGFVELRAQDPGPAPASLIQDEAHFLNEKRAGELGLTLKDVREKFGVSLYVVAFPYLREGAVRDRALQLAEHWSGEAPGLVLAVNRADAQSGIVASVGLWRRYPPDETVLALAEATALLTRPGAAPEERVMQTVALLQDRLAKMEAGRLIREKPLTKNEAHLAAWFAAVLVVLGGVAWLAVILWRRRAATRGALFFPDVEVGTRLGAPFGGGVIGVAGEKE